MNDEQKQLQKEFISKILSKNICEVKFTDIDGSESVMKCTTNLDLIPVEFHPKENFTEAKNESIQEIFDSENNQWKFFSWDSLIEVSVLHNR